MKILDFGIAKLHADQKQTATNMVLGTPLYMAPEQWENRADMDGRVDIYALGMILYECLTGTYPFTAKTAMQLMFAHSNKPVPDPGERVALPERLRPLAGPLWTPGEEPTTGQVQATPESAFLPTLPGALTPEAPGPRMPTPLVQLASMPSRVTLPPRKWASSGASGMGAGLAPPKP